VKKLFIFVCLLSLVGKVSAARTIKSTSPQKCNQKKKILIFTSDGGGGHRSVSAGLKNHYLANYDVKEVNVFADALAPIDTVRKITFGKYTSEDFYNFLLRNRWTKVANLFCRYGRWEVRSKSREKQITKLFLERVEEFNPDMLLSVVPFVNHALYNVAQAKRIPLLVLTNDLDTTNYTLGLKGPSYKKFTYTLAFNDDEMLRPVKKASIKKKNTAIIGFPLRPDFFEEKNKNVLRSEFNLPKNKPIVLLMMGAAGSQALYDYAKAICKADIPLHLVVCLGRSELLKQKIEKIKRNPGITLSTIGFTKRVADLMAVSHLFITKPGPGSVCEAVQMNLPLLADNTKTQLLWERFNLSFIKKHKLGGVVTKLSDVKQLLHEHLRDATHYATLKKRLQRFGKTQFPRAISRLVGSMLKT